MCRCQVPCTTKPQRGGSHHVHSYLVTPQNRVEWWCAWPQSPFMDYQVICSYHLPTLPTLSYPTPLHPIFTVWQKHWQRVFLQRSSFWRNWKVSLYWNENHSSWLSLLIFLQVQGNYQQFNSAPCHHRMVCYTWLMNLTIIDNGNFKLDF